MINPFFAMAKGGFEEYNDIVDEERALENAKRLAQATDTSKEVLSSNYFRTMGANGATNWFAFSDAKDAPARQERDLYSLAETATPQAMENLTEEEFNNWENKAAGIMQIYHASIVQKNEAGSIISTPNKHRMPVLLNNPYTQGIWKKILGGTYTARQPEDPNTKIYVSTNDAGDVNAEKIDISEKYTGFTPEEYEEVAKKYANIRGDDPNTAAAYYAKDYKQTLFLLEKATNVYNPNEPLGAVFRRVLNSSVIDPKDLVAINDSIKHINDTQGDVVGLGNYQIYKALEFIAPSKIEYNVPNSGEVEVMYKPKEYLKTLGIDVEALKGKRGSAKLGKNIATKIKNEIVTYRQTNGRPPPASSVLNNITQTLAAITEDEGGILSQLPKLADSTLRRFGVTDDGAAGYVQGEHAKYLKAIEAAGKGTDSKLIEAAKVGATIQLYSTMLAYQLAVAIQGGTGGRTVSDMDVRNMQKAFGDRLFVNSRVQIDVLEEVESFMQELIDSTGYFIEAAGAVGTLRPIMAANAFHKLYYGGLDAGKDVDTQFVANRLSQKIDKVKMLEKDNDNLPVSEENNFTVTLSGKGNLKAIEFNGVNALAIVAEMQANERLKAYDQEKLSVYNLEELSGYEPTTEEQAQLYLKSIGALRQGGSE